MKLIAIYLVLALLGIVVAHGCMANVTGWNPPKKGDVLHMKNTLTFIDTTCDGHNGTCCQSYGFGKPKALPKEECL